MGGTEHPGLLPLSQTAHRSLYDREREERLRGYGPAPEGQESRWYLEYLEDCEWPETTCRDLSVSCEDCPYYRPKH